MELDTLKTMVLHNLTDAQALDIIVTDVKALTAITDIMIICSGRSNRHVRAIANSLLKAIKSYHTARCEADADNEWILIDMNEILVHIMLPNIRALYNLEEFWCVKSPPTNPT